MVKKKLSNLVLNVETLGRDGLKQVLGGYGYGGGDWSACNVICTTDSDCWGACNYCVDIANWSGKKACSNSR